MPIVKRVRARAITAAAVVSPLLLLSGLGPRPAAAASRQTITVQVISGVDVTAFQKIAANFEKSHPDIAVQIQSVSDANLRGPNIPVLSSKNPPDVGWLQRGMGLYSTLVKHHALLSLSSLYSTGGLAKAYGNTLTKYYTAAGQQYGVLVDRATYDIVFYNKSEFKKAGISAPANHEVKSIAQLASMAKKLTAAGYQPLALAGNSPYMASWLLDAMIPTGVSSSQFENLLTNFKPGVQPTVSYTSPQFVRILNAINQLYTDHILVPNVLNLSDTAEPAEFAAGQAAMALSGTWGPGQFASDGAKFPVGWMALPPVIPGRTTPIAYWAGDSLVVPAHAQYPKAAKAFVAYVATPAVQNLLPHYSLIPGIGDFSNSALSALGSVDVSVLTAAKKLGSVPSWDLIVPPTLGQNWENQQIQAMWTGQITPTQLAAKFQAQWKKLH